MGKGLEGVDMALPPLTHSKKCGTPYRRPLSVESEIETAMSALATAEWQTQAVKLSALRLETLVCLARVRANANDPVALGKITAALLKAALPNIKRWRRGFTPTDAEEIDNAVAIQLVELVQLLAPTRTSEYLEISAGTVLKQLTLAEVAKRQDRPRPKDFVGQIETEDRTIDPIDNLADPGPDPLAQLLGSEAGRKSLRAMLKAVKDPRHRKAFILHKLRDWPVQSKTPGQPDLMGYFNMSRRQLHEWIKTASLQIKEALGGE